MNAHQLVVALLGLSLLTGCAAEERSGSGILSEG